MNASVMKRTVFVLLSLIYLANQGCSQYLVEVLEHTSFGTQRPVMRCEATGANFGQDVLEFSFSVKAVGCAVVTDPKNACNATHFPSFNGSHLCDSFFAVVPRGNCSFSEKAYHVQTAKPIGYNAIIVYGAPGQPPIPMSGSTFAEKVEIPVVMVNHKCMTNILGQYGPGAGYLLTLKASPGYYDLIKYLVPFVVIVGFCFIVLFISLVIRLCRERRRLARKRLSRSNLKKIPIKKYKKGDWPETCAICLEDFVEGEKIRVLPCRHSYHTKCIDPWLTKNRKVCPVCKRKVGPSNGSDSDSDTERGTQQSTPSTTREDDPLIRNGQASTTSASANFLSHSSPPRFQGRLLGFHWFRSSTNIEEPNPDQPGPSNIADESESEDESPSLARRAMNAFGRGFASFRARLARSGDNPHSRLENDDAISTTVTEVDVESMSQPQVEDEVSIDAIVVQPAAESNAQIISAEVERQQEV